MYDPLMVDLRNNFLLEASIILNEALPYQKNNVQADASWYIKWKGEYVITLKNSFTQFRQYALTQNNKYSKWLRDNREFFDARKYNPGSGCSIQSAPDYREAISRIKKPISVVINGEALSRISVPDSTNASKSSIYTSNVDNRWFYKMLIPEYNGNGDDFLKFARGYYNGNDKKKTINAKVMATYIPMMYNYCINYMNTVQILDNQLNTIIGFANRDPVSGTQNTSDDAVKQYQNQQQQNANNQYASTNANNNVVNASTEYEWERSVILNELGSTAPTSFMTPQSKSSMTSTTSRISNTINGGSKNTLQNKNQANVKGNTNGVNLTNNKVNQKQLAMKKKQVAANIVKDAFLCKLTASNAIYRDFITTLQVWAAGVQEQLKKSNERTAKKQAKAAEKTQTKQTENNTQGP